MNVEEMQVATQRLFQLLGQDGAQSFRMNSEVRAELGRLFTALEPRIHSVLWNQGLHDEFDRLEVASDVRQKLLTMNPNTAASVRTPWPYLHAVVTSVKNDYLNDQITRRRFFDDEPPEDDPEEGGSGGSGGGAAPAYDDRGWTELHYRRALEKLKARLSGDAYRLLLMWAAGYTAREMVAAHYKMSEVKVALAQEAAMRERVNQVVKKARHILGGDIF
jgi:hypothetical protein